MPSATAIKAVMPTSMNRSGSLRNAVAGPETVPAREGGLLRTTSDPADFGDKASIRLLFGMAGEPALLELRVQVHRLAIRQGAEALAFWQGCDSFKNFDQRLRGLEPAGIHLGRVGGNE